MSARPLAVTTLLMRSYRRCYLPSISQTTGRRPRKKRSPLHHFPLPLLFVWTLVRHFSPLSAPPSDQFHLAIGRAPPRARHVPPRGGLGDGCRMPSADIGLEIGISSAKAWSRLAGRLGTNRGHL